MFSYSLANYMFAGIIAGSPLLAIEVISRISHKSSELLRKLSHLLSALAVIVVAELFSISILVPLGIIFAFFIALITLTVGWKSLRVINRESYGEIAFPLGVFVAAFLAKTDTEFIFAMSCLGFVDVAAYVVGSRYGKNKFPKSNKTLEGFLAALITAFILALILLSATSYVAIHYVAMLVLSIAVAMSELVGTKGYDNILIPLTAILVYQWLLNAIMV